ncbi:hypothetical protein FJV83_15755 [Mesorhizobium sp. WSM4307]|uniref:hypothetical protein n=1 Tax=unclassified Mesorhizobium TaxID=325217 RepID=UPI00115E616A|nr:MULTISPECIES: hypothetical protein [unclassified Mesorhizobium]TRC76200.1 hypothetical protein FJV81_16415 [Mesorhizobium sp. WSM4315]TRC82662.1 hypothetical protein FJV80_20265 [Mesorhizobium sp. WSM4310]TRC84045.1 hypothetical protein FJV83_15755 [Mesorhizobium sp. WSM4307]
MRKYKLQQRPLRVPRTHGAVGVNGAHPSHASRAGKGETSDLQAHVGQNDNAPQWKRAATSAEC